MNFRDIEISDYKRLHMFTEDIMSAQYSFAYYYVYNKRHGVKVCFEEDCFFVRVEYLDTEEYMAFLMPLGTLSCIEKIERITVYANSHHKKVRIWLATKQDMEYLEANSICFEATSQRERWDYIYTPENICNTFGKHNGHKRRKLNQFHYMNPNVSVEIIKKESFSSVEMFHNRLQESGAVYEGFEVESFGLRNVFQHYEELECIGIIVSIEGQIEGYFLGIPINETVVDAIAMKSNHAISGLSTFIKVEFAKVASKYTYINYEEDLDIPGLRTVKMRLHPDLLLEKYSLLLY